MAARHRNPRPKVPKPPSAHNPPPRPRTAVEHWAPRNRRELTDAFGALIRQNPQAASATLDVLEMVANSPRRRAMRLVEVISRVVSSIRGAS